MGANHKFTCGAAGSAYSVWVERGGRWPLPVSRDKPSPLLLESLCHPEQRNEGLFSV